MIPKNNIKAKDRSSKDCVKSNELLSRVFRVRFPGGSPTIPLAMRIYAVAKGIFCISAYVILAMIIGRVSRNSSVFSKEKYKKLSTKLDNCADIV